MEGGSQIRLGYGRRWTWQPFLWRTSLVWHLPTLKLRHKMATPNQIPAPTKPLMAGCQQEPCSASWIDAATKPTGWERKVLVWVVWPQCGWPQWPEPLIGWWKHGPGCFAVGNVENANHLVTHWMDISEPNKLL